MSASKADLQKNWIEWLVFGVGLVLVLGTLAALTRQALLVDRGPARVEVRLGTPRAERPGGTRLLVPVTGINRGGETAERVRVEVLREHRGRSERAELEIDSLPRYAERSGWVLLEGDAGDGAMTGRVLGYLEP
jgi:uncharacterized protein (TIGR02588 family)